MFVVGQAVVDCAVGDKKQQQQVKELHRMHKHSGTHLFTWLRQLLKRWSQSSQHNINVYMTPSVNTPNTQHLLAVVAKTEMCSLVEEHADALV